MELLEKLNHSGSVRSIATEFGMSKSTVSNTKLNHAIIMNAWEANCSSKWKRMRDPQLTDIDKGVSDFLLCVVL